MGGKPPVPDGVPPTLDQLVSFDVYRDRFLREFDRLTRMEARHGDSNQAIQEIIEAERERLRDRDR